MTVVRDHSDHQPGEATPDEVIAPAATPTAGDFGLHDASWSGDEWERLLRTLISEGFASWKDVTALVLGHLNPSQVGTSLASSEGFKRKYGKGNTMRVVMDWAYRQTGRCADCGTRLELQADHMKGREEFDDPLDADFIENMTLRCRRCNVIRRPSHEFGGLTFLTAEAALMWILFVIRPRTLFDYKKMCRLYGMTMSDIRMEEAWAMAHWLARANPPAYGIEDDARGHYDLVLWQDGAITRVEAGGAISDGGQRFYEGISGSAYLGFVAQAGDGKLRAYEYAISSMPFSTYDLGSRPPQSLAIRYSPPDREKKERSALSALPPRGMKLIWHAVRYRQQRFRLLSTDDAIRFERLFLELSFRGTKITVPMPLGRGKLEAIYPLSPEKRSVEPPA